MSHFGGIRPDCLINLIPANGLLLFPEGSSGCTCSFPLRCSVAFTHKKKRLHPWSVFVTHGAMSPIKHFAVNLGAPADMKDENDTVWFGYPNPKTESKSNHFPQYGVKFSLNDQILDGMGYFCADARSVNVEGTDRPWLFASGCLGLSRCDIPVIDDIWGEEPGVYTVRLGFRALSGDRPGQRLFDIKLQDNIVLKNFDVLQEAETPLQAVIEEFKGIDVENVLTVEFLSKQTNPTRKEAPIINFIEVIREDSAEYSKVPGSIKPIIKTEAESLLRSAQTELKNQNYEKALEYYHAVLDAAPNDNLKLKALDGMAAIANPKSLKRLAKYCRDDAPILIEERRRNILRPNTKDSILWNYEDPHPELIKKAFKAYIAIASNTAKKDKTKGIRMLNHALSKVDQDIRKQAAKSLEDLGIKTDVL